jgi:hypothetical protein
MGEMSVKTDLVARIKEWALANYSKNYGASCLIECFEDEELAREFQSLADAKRYARLMSEQFSNAQF